jgi:hypothetical protein
MKLKDRLLELGPHTKGDTTDERQLAVEGLLDPSVIKSVRVIWKLGTAVIPLDATHTQVDDEPVITFSLGGWAGPVGMYIGEVEFTWLDDTTTTWWTKLQLPVRGEAA